MGVFAMNERATLSPGSEGVGYVESRAEHLGRVVLDLRLCIGVLGVALPFILRIGSRRTSRQIPTELRL